MPESQDVSALTRLSTKLGLRPEQIAVAHYMALPKAQRPPIIEFSKEVGLDRTNIWRMQKNKRVITLARELMKRYFFNDLADILEAMKTKALQGDTRAATIMIEYIEDYQRLKKESNSPVTVNVVVTPQDIDARLSELRRKVIDI